MKTRLTAALSAAFLMLALSACTTDAPQEPGDEVRVWLVGSDTPDEARDYLVRTFESQHSGVTLTIEERAWVGLVDTLTEALSGPDGPDVVELGNTQSPTFTSGGYFREISQEELAELGGPDLLASSVEIGDWEGKHYALPYYVSAPVVFFSPHVTGPLETPATLDEFVDLAESLTTDTVSGLYWPGRGWQNGLPFVWENGGFIAEQHDDGVWTAGFSTEGGIAGLEQVQELMLDANHAPPDVAETDPQDAFCAGTVGLLAAPASVQTAIAAGADAERPGCADGLGADLTAFALPGQVAGSTAQVLGGGSNIAISDKSRHPDLAYEALKIMLSDNYQAILGAHGLIPATRSLSHIVPRDNPVARAAVDAAANIRLTPATPRWAEVEAQEVMPAAFSRLAHGEDVTTVAIDLDAQIEQILNGGP